MAVSGAPCATPCTTGACGNWDAYVCSAGDATKCATPPLPPPSPPPPPPPPSPFGFAGALSDHMVLQRNVPARVWGTGGTPNGTVSVELSDGAVQSVVANATGDWAVDLTAREASIVSINITVVDHSTNRTVTLHDVLFGDVWGCHGQSDHMACPVNLGTRA